MAIRMRMRPKKPARDSPTMVPFGCDNDECGREAVIDAEGAGIIKEGSELEEGRGIVVNDV